MTEPRKIILTIPEPSILLNVWQRMHWRERRNYHEKLALLVRSSVKKNGYSVLKEPIQHCLIHVDRYSSGQADWDGLVGGFKPLFDCLVVKTRTNPLGIGIIQDDNPNCVVECPTAKQHKAPRNEGKTILTITEVVQ